MNVIEMSCSPLTAPVSESVSNTEHQPDTIDYFSLLPDELIGKIFDKCTSRTTVNLSMVSHRFRVLVTDGMTVQTALGFIKINPMFYRSPTIRVNNSVKNDDNVIVAALKRSPELFNCLTDEQKNNLLFRQIAWFSSQAFGEFDLGTRLLGDQFSNWFPGKTEEDVCADSALVDPKYKDIVFTLRQQYLSGSKAKTGFAPCLDDMVHFMKLECPWIYYPKSDSCLKAWCSVEGISLQFASEAQTNNPKIIMTAVRQNGYALQYASAKLKNDKDIVLEAVRQNGRAWEYASEALKNDRDIVLEAVRQDGRVLEYVVDELKNDRDIVLAAVRQNGWALGHASEELKNDRDIVFEAVRQNGWALGYASEALKNDSKIVMAAVRQNIGALRYASAELKMILAAGESAKGT